MSCSIRHSLPLRDLLKVRWLRAVENENEAVQNERPQETQGVHHKRVLACVNRDIARFRGLVGKSCAVRTRFLVLREATRLRNPHRKRPGGEMGGGSSCSPV